MNLFKLFGSDEDGLQSMKEEKTLKKIPVQQLGIMTFQRLDKHIRYCGLMSNLTVGLLAFLALVKISEIFHIPLSLFPILTGG